MPEQLFGRSDRNDNDDDNAAAADECYSCRCSTDNFTDDRSLSVVSSLTMILTW